MRDEVADLFLNINEKNIKYVQEYAYNILKSHCSRKIAWGFSLAVEEVISNVMQHDYNGSGPFYLKIVYKRNLISATIVDFNKEPHYEAIDKKIGYTIIEQFVDKVITDENFAIGKKTILLKSLNNSRSIYYENKTSDLSDSVVERITGLRSLSATMYILKKEYQTQKQLRFIFIGLSNIQKFESFLGFKAYDLIIKAIASSLKILKGNSQKTDWIITQPTAYSDQFLIFMTHKDAKFLNSNKTAKILNNVKDEIIRELSYFIEEQLIEKFDIHTNLCNIKYEQNVRFERILWRRINEEIKNSMLNEDAINLLMQKDLRNILKNGSVTSVFQGIFNKKFDLIGYEALARGPKGSLLFFPEALYATAYKMGVVPDLELISLKSHIESFKKTGLKDKLIFINIESLAILHRTAGIISMLNKLDYDYKNIVIELTERTIISDLAVFKKKLARLKKFGLKIAIDDVGSGYSNLVMLAELKPDILKIDMNVIKGIHNDKVKQNIIKTIVTFAKTLRSKIVAEGIEQKSDLDILQQYAIDYFQGFYLHRPTELNK